MGFSTQATISYICLLYILILYLYSRIYNVDLTLLSNGILCKNLLSLSLSDELHTSTLEVLVLLCVFKLFMEYISNCFYQKLFVFGLKFSLSYLNFFFIFLFILQFACLKHLQIIKHIKIFGFLIKTAVSCSLLNLIIFFQLFFKPNIPEKKNLLSQYYVHNV